MVTGSTFVILVALAGNLAIAIAKFVASWISGSTAMYTEAIHSLVDTGDQILLLIGQKRGERPPDARHPLGHGMETYFWSFIVALMVFLLGGVLSVYEGVRQILEPEPVVSPWISLGVLAIAATFEGTSFRIAYREYRRVVRGRPTRLWDFIKGSKDPALFSVLLEDSAALGRDWRGRSHVLSSYLGGRHSIDRHWSLARERRLCARQRDAQPDRRRGCRANRYGAIAEGPSPDWLHHQPRRGGDSASWARRDSSALTLSFRRDSTTDMIEDAIRDVTEALQEADERVVYVYIRPSERVGNPDRKEREPLARDKQDAPH